MTEAIALDEGVIRPRLRAELEAFRAPERRVSSYYLCLHGNSESRRLTVKNSLAEQRKQLDQLDLGHDARMALGRDWERVQELALLTAGQRGTRSLACFVASEDGYARVLRLPWPIRDRAFFEDRFVLWPLYQVLDQADRFAICLTDKEKGRLFLFHLEQIEEVVDILDEIPGRVRFPDPLRAWHYVHKHVEHFHHHFENVAQAALRLWQREPFEHLIIGGRRETLPQFEGHLHPYLRDRVIARWDIDVRTPTPQIRERTQKEEEQLQERQAQTIWQAIQDDRPQRGALGPEEVFAALWQRRVQALLVEPGAARSGYRCTACGRLQLGDGACRECGGNQSAVPDILDEAVHEAVEQNAQVRTWKDAALSKADSIAALKRF